MSPPSSTTPAQALRHWSREDPRRIAVVDGERTYNYGRFAEIVTKFVLTLRANGVRCEMLVGLQGQDRTITLALILACEVLNATHATLSAGELTVQDRVARRCDLLVTEVATSPLWPGQSVIHSDRAWVEEALALSITAESLSVLQTESPRDRPVRLGRTSGTTGAPKFMLNRRGLISAIIDSYDVCYRPVRGVYAYLCLYWPTVRGVYLDLMRALIAGNTILFIGKGQQIEQIEKLERCYAFLLTREAETLAGQLEARNRFLNLLYADVVGSSVSPGLHARLRRTLTSRILSAYSSNETSVVAVMPETGPGIVLPQVEVMIVDEGFCPLPDGEIGMIAVRGPGVIEGYLWDDALTKRHFRNGWFLMNDFGRRPAPGLLEVLGRADDMLNLGGEKVSPYPTEQALKTLNGVADAVLVSGPDELGVERFHVVIERADAKDDSRLGAEIVQVMRKHHAAKFMLHFRDTLPRTHTGKVQRSMVLESLPGARKMDCAMA